MWRNLTNFFCRCERACITFCFHFQGMVETLDTAALLLNSYCEKALF